MMRCWPRSDTRKDGFNPQTLREVLQACQQQGCVANNLDLDVVMIIIDGAFSGIVQNWLMNMAGYDLYKQAPLWSITY